MSVASSYLALGSQRIGTDWAMLCSLVSLVRQKFLLEEISKPLRSSKSATSQSKPARGIRGSPVTIASCQQAYPHCVGGS